MVNPLGVYISQDHVAGIQTLDNSKVFGEALSANHYALIASHFLFVEPKQ